VSCDIKVVRLDQLTRNRAVRLREMDIELMRRLSPRVNVIPVIGKSDSLTPSELSAFKRRVKWISIISRNRLQWHSFLGHGRH
jgi:septin family protein